MSTTLPAIAPAAAAVKAKPSAVVRRGPPARRAASPPSVVTYGASSAKAWPAPCLVGREVRGAAEREQRLGTRLTLDLGATEADEEVSSDWPRPALTPQGPLRTALADKQRLMNALAREEEAHAASLRQMRRDWEVLRREEAARLYRDGDGIPETDVEARRLVSMRARRQREEERILARVTSGKRAREARRRGEAEVAAQEAWEREAAEAAAARAAARELRLRRESAAVAVQSGVRGQRGRKQGRAAAAAAAEKAAAEKPAKEADG